MCGLAGFLQSDGFSLAAAESDLRKLCGVLHHRGPDAVGTWIDAEAGIALGHQRLAVIDLSSAGEQPTRSPSGRYVIAYNGELYNHSELRHELNSNNSNLQWRGHSDTETLLAAVDHWGIESALKKSVGMFALALWDREERVLTLARDRIGEKPLYFGWQRGIFLFGSELKALRVHPSFQPEIDRESLAVYLQQGFIPAPLSIYKNIFKLMPGTIAQLSSTDRPGTMPRAKSYWTLKEAVNKGLDRPFEGSDEDAVRRLDELLRQSVSLQSVADVPVGAFLSGGIDSSTIVAVMQQEAKYPVRTFSIGFEEGQFNEATYAKAVANYLGTVHTELYVSPREAMDVIPQIPSMFDEPFGDSSAIPTYLVSMLARQQVTVSLSGDGGDELFGGYGRYRRTAELWRKLSRLPNSLRLVLSHGSRMLSHVSRNSSASWRAERLARYLAARNIPDFYDVQMTQRHDAGDMVLGCGVSSYQRDHLSECDRLFDTMMYADTVNYLPDDILTKVDRASMSVSLESRVPMLDHRVVEFAWQLPLHMKSRDGGGKWLLRQVLRKYVPDELVERPKMGFGIPVGEWIRGPLRDWAEEHLAESRLRHDGFLDPQLVRNQWQQHLSGESKRDDNTWQLLMFQAWLSCDTAGVA